MHQTERELIEGDCLSMLRYIAVNLVYFGLFYIYRYFKFEFLFYRILF